MPTSNVVALACASPTRTWRDQLQVHPAADVFPMMTDAELQALAENIKQNGLLHRVVLTHGENADGTVDVNKQLVLDGRNRLEAMQRLGWRLFDKKGRPRDDLFTDLALVSDEFVDESALVIAANVHRRHLTPEQRRQVIAKLLTAEPDASNRSIAGQVSVDHKTVGSVRAELEARGEIPHVATVKDRAGRKQPSKRRQAVARASTQSSEQLREAEIDTPAAVKAEAPNPSSAAASEFRVSCADDLLKAMAAISKFAALNPAEIVAKALADEKALPARLAALTNYFQRISRALPIEQPPKSITLSGAKRSDL